MDTSNDGKTCVVQFGGGSVEKRMPLAMVPVLGLTMFSKWIFWATDEIRKSLVAAVCG